MELQLHDALVRPWRSADAEALARNANARSIWLNLRDGFPPPYTLADVHAFLERALPTPWCIGDWLGERFWGRGIASQAVAAVTDHAYPSRKLPR